MEHDLSVEVLAPILLGAAAFVLAVRFLLRKLRRLREDDDLAARAFERHRRGD